MIILGLYPQLVPFRSLSKFNRLFALDIAIFICDRKLNVFVIVTPSSVASSTWSISSPNNWSLICLPFFLSTISCVFLAFNLILHLEHHFSRADNVLWIRYWTYVASLGPNVHIPRSSTKCDILTCSWDLLEYHSHTSKIRVGWGQTLGVCQHYVLLYLTFHH